jgi:hypothetical protein
MTRTLALSVIVLLGSATLAHAQSTTTSSSAGCGPEIWSTDKMAYVGVPCADAATPQQAVAPATDLQYCGALVALYDTLLNKTTSHGTRIQSTNNAANVAADRCRSGDPRGIADLERALKDAQVALPPRH